MQTALAASLLIGLACALLGVYVVLRQMAFISDALSHTALPGIVVAYLNGWSLFVGALGACLLSSLAIGWLARRRVIREDTAIGTVFVALFAVGIMLMTARSTRDVASLLFGNVLGVTPEDLLLIGGVTGIVCLVLGLLHKELEISSFDPVYAETLGFSPDLLRFLLLMVLALAIVAGIQAVGVILVSGLLITPAAAASLVARNSLRTMMIVAAGLGMLSSICGLYASYYLNVPSGPAIVLSSTACFFLVWTGRELRSLVGRRASRRPS
jgi:manganese/iron transport system permease protein